MAGGIIIWIAFLGIAVSSVAQVASSENFGPDNWVAIGDGIRGANGKVIDMVTDGAGNVYVAGNFTAIGDVAANYIAKWDGKAWSALGSGMDDQVATLALSGSDLCAGGIFTTAGGLEVPGLPGLPAAAQGRSRTSSSSAATGSSSSSTIAGPIFWSV